MAGQTSKTASLVVALAMTTMIMMSEVAKVKVEAAGGPCGSTPIGSVAASLSPCAGAARNGRAPVAPACCAQLRRVLKRPACLCAVFLSPIARRAGINPAVAIAVPKRCNIRNRPAGKRCGRYVVP